MLNSDFLFRRKSDWINFDKYLRNNKMFGLNKKSTDTTISPRAYCVKCRETMPIFDPQQVILKKGNRPALKGSCSECGTGVYKILPREIEKNEPSE